MHHRHVVRSECMTSSLSTVGQQPFEKNRARMSSTCRGRCWLTPLALLALLCAVTPTTVAQDVINDAAPLPVDSLAADASTLLEVAAATGLTWTAGLAVPWVADTPHCTWTGVSCNSDNEVTYVVGEVGSAGVASKGGTGCVAVRSLL